MEKIRWMSGALLLALVLGCAEGSTEPPPPSPTGIYYVILKDHVQDVEVESRRIAAAHGLEIRYIFTYAPQGFSAAVPEQAIEALLEDPDVDRLQPVTRGGALGS